MQTCVLLDWNSSVWPSHVTMVVPKHFPTGAPACSHSNRSPQLMDECRRRGVPACDLFWYRRFRLARIKSRRTDYPCRSMLLQCFGEFLGRGRSTRIARKIYHFDRFFKLHCRYLEHGMASLTDNSSKTAQYYPQM